MTVIYTHKTDVQHVPAVPREVNINEYTVVRETRCEIVLCSFPVSISNRAHLKAFPPSSCRRGIFSGLPKLE